jgi:choline monooxygenase
VNGVRWSPSLITDPNVWAVEQRSVFASNWVAIARSSDVAGIGDFVTAMVGDEPVVVVREDSSSLRAMSNVCRHRGTMMVEGTGTTRSIQCPNHRWTYRLDGTLASAPSMDDVADFDKSSLCLPPFAVCEWQGWVLVNLTGTAAPLSEVVPHLDEHLADSNFAAMQRAGTLTFPSPWNWKISVENFAESYHHQSVHPETLQPLYPGAQSFVVDSHGEPWTWLDHVSTAPWAEPFTASVVFPTLLFSWIRPNAMAWFHLEPLSASETTLTIELFVQPDDVGDQELIGTLLESLRQINAEDIDINRRTFIGLHSSTTVIGPLSNLEAAVGQFRAWILAQLANDLPRLDAANDRS